LGGKFDCERIASPDEWRIDFAVADYEYKSE